MKSNWFKLIIALCLLSSINISCDYRLNIDTSKDKNSKKISGEGELVEKSFDLSGFTKIDLYGEAKINIVKGNEQSIKVKVQQNILEALDLSVSEGKLKIGIKDNYKINASKGLFVEIITPSDITDASINGAGEITFANNQQNSFNVSISGAGNINAYDLKVENCTIDINGAGNCNVYVSSKLNVNIAGVGNVNYKGHPNISQSISGMGNIHNAN